MNRIVKIDIRDVIFDHKNVSDILNQACLRTPIMRIAGGFKFSDNLILCLEEIEKTGIAPENYVIAPLDELSEDDVIAEINSRYNSGFSTNFCFEANNKIWGVFSKKISTTKSV